MLIIKLIQPKGESLIHGFVHTQQGHIIHRTFASSEAAHKWAYKFTGRFNIKLEYV